MCVCVSRTLLIQIKILMYTSVAFYLIKSRKPVKVAGGLNIAEGV